MITTPDTNTPGINPGDLDTLATAVKLTQATMSPQVRAELLAPFAEDVAPGTEWAVLAGIGAANVRELLHIIDRMGREARRMRGQLAEFAAASADATRAEMARQGITGKELAK